jgi:hypothetical protein
MDLDRSVALPRRAARGACGVKEAAGGGFGIGYGASRFDEMNAFGSGYTTPGWQRAGTRAAADL